MTDMKYIDHELRRVTIAESIEVVLRRMTARLLAQDREIDELRAENRRLTAELEQAQRRERTA